MRSWADILRDKVEDAQREGGAECLTCGGEFAPCELNDNGDCDECVESQQALEQLVGSEFPALDPVSDEELAAMFDELDALVESCAGEFTYVEWDSTTEV